MPSSCTFCDKEVSTIMHCGKCRQADYCSKDCQTRHWNKHKQNCVKSDHSIHALFKLCREDLFPNSGSKVAIEYGFDNVLRYHADVLWGASSLPCSAEHILLGLWQMICKDSRDSRFAISSIGASRKMIVNAMESNKLDEFLHLYIKDVFRRYGANTPKYCQYALGWIWNRMVIGPTRTEGMTQEQIQQARREIYHKYYGNTDPVNCCCETLNKEPVVGFPGF